MNNLNKENEDEVEVEVEIEDEDEEREEEAKELKISYFFIYGFHCIFSFLSFNCRVPGVETTRHDKFRHRSTVNNPQRRCEKLNQKKQNNTVMKQKQMQKK